MRLCPVRGRHRPASHLAAVFAIVLSCTVTVGAGASDDADPVDLADLVIVADDNAVFEDGCDAVSVFSLRSVSPVYRGRTFVSPGRLAGTPDFSLVLANNTSFLPERFLYRLRREPGAPSGWSTEGQVFGAAFTSVGGIAISPDGDTFLVATQVGGTRAADPASGTDQFSRYAVGKYRLSEMWRDPLNADRWLIGPERGRFAISHIVAEILMPGPEVAHLVTVNQEVITLDVATMTEKAAPIEMASLGPEAELDAERYVGAVHATIDKDGRYLVTNRWEAPGPKLNVADLRDRTTWTLTLAGNLDRAGGVALNRAEENPGLLAVHGREHVAVYRFEPRGPLHELARVEVRPSPYGLIGINGPVHSVAWSGTGSHVVAEDVGTGHGIGVFAVADGGRRLVDLHRWRLCPAAGKPDWPNDILTANGLLPTATDAATPTRSPAPPATATPTVTPSPSPTATASPTASPSPTPTPTATRTPRPPSDIFLPLALRERCPPFTVYVDVALVVDASTSMLETTSQGRTKLDAVREALRTFVAGMRLETGGDRAALITFNHRSRRLQALTWDREMLDAAIARIEAEPGSRVDSGIHRAIFELAGTPTQRNRYLAMVVLSDGRADPVSDAEVIAAADAARESGIVMYVVGVGPNMNRAVLQAMAGDADRFVPAPEAEALSAIYASLTGRVICPPSFYWPRR